MKDDQNNNDHHFDEEEMLSEMRALNNDSIDSANFVFENVPEDDHHTNDSNGDVSPEPEQGDEIEQEQGDDIVSPDASVQHNRPRYNLRSARGRDFSKHIGRINNANEYTFVQQPKVPDWEQQERRWSEDIYSQVHRITMARITKERHTRDAHKLSVQVIFNQMTANRGIQLFGEKVIAEILQEYRQLYNMDVFARVNTNELTRDQRHKAIRAIILIKEIRCGKIKGRTCADGSSQRSYIPMEEASSPTVSLEGLVTTMAIDAYEKRSVAVFMCLELT